MAKISFYNKSDTNNQKGFNTMKEYDVLKIKGILKYFKINKNNIFKDYDTIMENAEISSSNVTLNERKSLLHVYLYIYAKSHIKKFMELLNYQDLEKINLDLFEIIEDSISNESNKQQELRGEIIINAIIDEVVNTYLLSEEEMERITTEVKIGDKLHTFLSYKKLKPLILIELNKYSYIEDIRSIMEKIVIEYKKISAFEFLNISEIEKYEVFIKNKDQDGNIVEELEILYLL